MEDTEHIIEVVEIGALSEVSSLGKYNEKLSVMLNLWVIHELNTEQFKLKDYELILLKLNYFGDYPAIGFVHKHGFSSEKEDEIIALSTALLAENSISSFLKFIVDEESYIEAEWTYYKRPDWVPLLHHQRRK